VAPQVTVFSVKDTEVDVDTPDDDPSSLPAYNELTSKITRSAATPMLELGTRWATLHHLFGGRESGEPLGFLAGGGSPVPALDDGRASSGRYFAPAVTVAIAAALEATTDHELTARVSSTPVGVPKLTAVEVIRLVDKLRAFLGDAVRSGRGIVVHRFS
jgi:hypothetical protein